MTQEERRCYLIQYLLKEEIRFRKQKIPKKKQGARDHRHCRPDTGSI